MNIKKILFVILLHFFALNLFPQEQTLSIIEFRSLTEDDSTAKYVTNLLIQKIEEIDSLSQISVRVLPQPVPKENDYVTLKPLADSTECDYLITGDVNIIDSIFALTIYIIDTNHDKFSSPINIITYNNSTGISEKLERVAYIIMGDMRYSDAINIISLENEEKNKKIGWLIFISDVRKAQIFMDNEYIGETPFVKKVKFGSYNIKMVNPDYGISEKYNCGKYTNSNSIIFKSLKPSWVIFDDHPIGAKIHIDKQVMDFLPHKATLINSKKENLLITKTGYYNYNSELHLRSYQKDNIKFSLKPKSKSINIYLSTIYPGLGQIYRDDLIRGYLYSGIETYFLVQTFLFNKDMHDLNDKIDDLTKKYNNANQIEDILYLEQALRNKHSEIEKVNNKRNKTAIWALAIWGISFIDSILWEKPPAIPEVSMSEINKIPVINISYNFN